MDIRWRMDRIHGGRQESRRLSHRRALFERLQHREVLAEPQARRRVQAADGHRLLARLEQGRVRGDRFPRDRVATADAPLQYGEQPGVLRFRAGGGSRPRRRGRAFHHAEGRDALRGRRSVPVPGVGLAQPLSERGAVAARFQQSLPGRVRDARRADLAAADRSTRDPHLHFDCPESEGRRAGPPSGAQGL